MSKRIAVLASGRGSNLTALHSYLQEEVGSAARVARIALVASNQAGAGALEIARELGKPAITLRHRGADGEEIAAIFREHQIDIVVLAGYLRLLPRVVVKEYRGRIVNVHPALLPAFGGPGMYGERVHRAVLDSGARVTGATVHFVDEEYDRGATIAQWPVPVADGDTASTLAARVLRVEHLLLPRATEAVALGALSLGDDGRVVRPFRGARQPDAAFTLQPEDDEHIGDGIAAMLRGGSPRAS